LRRQQVQDRSHAGAVSAVRDFRRLQRAREQVARRRDPLRGGLHRVVARPDVQDHAVLEQAIYEHPDVEEGW
jgi:hypothetical protein